MTFQTIEQAIGYKKSHIKKRETNIFYIEREIEQYKADIRRLEKRFLNMDKIK